MIREISKPRLTRPVFIPVWPGMGEVALRAGLFLREALSFKPFAKLEARGFFPITGIVIKQGFINIPSIPGGFFYYYKRPEKKDIILFIGEAQPPLQYGEKLVETIVNFISTYNPEMVISFAAKPEPIEHKARPKLWIAATEREIKEKFKKIGLPELEKGQVAGLNGLILGAAKRKNLKGAIILGEIPLYTVQIENPKTTAEVLKVVDTLLDLNLNLSPLLERGAFIETEIDRMVEYLKGDVRENKPLGDEDIERIKKDLAAYTRLPHSAREKIEALFKDAQKDISKARELKEELDRWNVYKEYEDRFLELFKKNKNKEDTH